MTRPDQLRRWSSIAAISIALVSVRAHAQNAEAEALFSDGDKLMKQGKLAQACDAFEASNRIEARAGTLIRLGECREQNHQIASAWSAYKDALVRVKDPKKQKIATAKVGELEPKLSYLTIDVAKLDGLEITRNGKSLDPGLWNRAVPVDGGDYALAATAPGHKPWKQSVTVPITNGTVVVTVPALEAEPVAAPARQHDVLIRTGYLPPEPEPSTFTTRRKIALGVGVVGVGALVAGALLGSSAKHAQDDAFALCPDAAMPCAQAAAANAKISTAHDRALEANIAFAAGGVAVIAAGVLWFTGSPERPARTALVPTTNGIALAGKF